MGEVLEENGYNTSWFGKMHNVPDWMSSQAGPFNLWPSGLGFEYFYGFIGGDTNQWHPALYENTTPIEPDRGNPNYILDHDLADKSIAWMRMQHALAPAKPWFLYYATGTAHSPHHAPKEWIEKYKGQFDQGWDKVREETLARQIKLGVVPANTQLTKRPDEIPAWDTLSADQKRLYAHMMEVYAGALSHADNQIGRLLDAIQDSGQLDNTLIILHDGRQRSERRRQLARHNKRGGDSRQWRKESLPYLLSMIDKLGGPLTYNHYPGWLGARHGCADAVDEADRVAFRRHPQWHGDLVACADQGQGRHPHPVLPCHRYRADPLRSHRHHATDDFDGVQQKPLEGTSLVYTFDNASAPTRHTTQYFEMLGNRAIYKDGWMASTTPLRLPWVTIGSEPSPDDFKWELYNIDNDFSQANNLADKNPGKLKELQDAFDVEAKKYNVYPLDSSFASRVDPAIRPSLTRGRNEFTYYPGMIRIPEGSAPNFKNGSWTIAAEVAIPENGASGVLATMGGRFAGWGLLMQDSKPQFVYALSNQPEHKFRIASDQPISPGNHVVRLNFKYDGGGVGKGATGTLFVDGKQVAQGRIPQTVRLRFSLDETFDIGEDTGTPVVEDYADKMPYRFTGTLKKFVVLLEPEKLTEEERKHLLEEEAKAYMAMQ